MDVGMVEGGSGGRVHLGGERRGFAARGGASGRAPSAGQRESSEFGWWTSGRCGLQAQTPMAGFGTQVFAFFVEAWTVRSPAGDRGRERMGGGRRADGSTEAPSGRGRVQQAATTGASLGARRGSRFEVGGRWSSLGTRRRRKRARYSVEVMRMDPRCDVSGSPTTSGGDCGWKGGGRELPELPSFQWG